MNVIAKKEKDGQPQQTPLVTAVQRFVQAKHVVALSGAGISVGSGIPDFRSRTGLWSQFAPEEYATLQGFLSDSAKVWQMYRAMDKILQGKKANPAHLALAQMEEMGCLSGIVTQNIDGLHQQAGNSIVLEMHGEIKNLQCIRCGWLESALKKYSAQDSLPTCSECGFVLKPNVVLFGEDVRFLQDIEELLAPCDLLLVLGTSAQVYPAARLPTMVQNNGGLIYEFNQEPALSARDYLFQGDIMVTLPRFVDAVTHFMKRG